MKLFGSKHYPALMFLLILSVLVLTLFNLMSILEKTANKDLIQNQNNMQENSPISGLVTLKIDTNPPQINSPEAKVSLYFYILIGGLFLFLYVLIKFIYKK